jgi:hypothetical protein
MCVGEVIATLCVGEVIATLCEYVQVRNLLDEVHPPRDFYSLVKPAIDDMIGRDVTFDILFHNSEHQATLFRYGLKKSTQVRVGMVSACVCVCLLRGKGGMMCNNV